ncbi:hypothetical protein [Pseudactinotalea sp.]|uniref:hypothetical protein n=1 Tax=Pseudactinotalea sp. TaxID=1926260 RepID=UPI003B3A5EE0
MSTRRTATILGAAIMVAALLGACSDGGTDTPPDGTTTASQTPSEGTEPSTTDAGTTDPASTESGTAAGCAATDDTVPPEAELGPTADLDGDGAADELWLADVDGTHMLGVQTASGAVFSTEFTSAAPQAASALGQVLGDGSAIVLLDTGREVPLYAVIDCALTPTQNDQAEQYTFDRGFTGYGTGVGCIDVDGGGLSLVGYLAEVEGERATVTTTAIELSDGGAAASNGEATEQTDLDADDPAVEAASEVSCGDAEPVMEPQG